MNCPTPFVSCNFIRVSFSRSFTQVFDDFSEIMFSNALATSSFLTHLYSAQIVIVTLIGITMNVVVCVRMRRLYKKNPEQVSLFSERLIFPLIPNYDKTMKNKV
jgi:hypothetical protein